MMFTSLFVVRADQGQTTPTSTHRRGGLAEEAREGNIGGMNGLTWSRKRRLVMDAWLDGSGHYDGIANPSRVQVAFLYAAI